MKTSANINQHGFTLIELMIAITISVILLNGVIQIFQSSKQSYRVADNIGRVQENARYALDVLSKNIRQAGFLPCRIAVDPSTNLDKVVNVLGPPPGESNNFFTTPIIGFEGGNNTFPTEFPI